MVVVVELDVAVEAAAAAAAVGVVTTGRSLLAVVEDAVQVRRLLVGGRVDGEAGGGALRLVLLRPAVQPPRLLLGRVLHADPDLWLLRRCGGGCEDDG